MIRVPFSVDAPFVARDRLLHDGKRYDTGTPFPGLVEGTSSHDLAMLWGQGYIDCAPSVASPLPALLAEIDAQRDLAGPPSTHVELTQPAKFKHRRGR